jgi:hypothetical protein
MYRIRLRDVVKEPLAFHASVYQGALAGVNRKMIQRRPMTILAMRYRYPL